jgi:hypothetical protein
MTRYSAEDLAHHFAKSRRRKKAKRKTVDHSDAALFGALFGGKKRKDPRRVAAGRRAYLKRKREGTWFQSSDGALFGAKKKPSKKTATRREGPTLRLDPELKAFIRALAEKQGINLPRGAERKGPQTLAGVEAYVKREMARVEREKKEKEARQKELEKIEAYRKILEGINEAKSPHRRRRGRKPGPKKGKKTAARRGRKPGPKKGSHRRRASHGLTAAKLKKLLGH